MNRYAIDDLPASGPLALYLLSVVATLKRNPQLTLKDLVEEATAYSRTHDGRTGIYFEEYFLPDQRRLQFKAPSSSAFTPFCNFIDAAVASSSGLRIKAEDVFGEGKILPVVKMLGDLKERVEPTLKWESRRGRDGCFVNPLSEHAIRLRLVGLSPEFRSRNPDCGVFYVVREARGLLSSQPNRRNLVVRDLLWLRHTETPAQSRAASAGRPARSGDPTSMAPGYYFSVVDESVYRVGIVEGVFEGQIQVLGRRISEDRDEVGAHHFYLSARKLKKIDEKDVQLPRGSRTRPGLLAGSTRNARRPAAWKTVIADVPDDARALELELDLERIVGQQLLEPAHGDLMAALDYLQAREHIGLLASHEAAEQDPGEMSRLLELRGALKHLMATRRKGLVASELARKAFHDLLNPTTQDLITEIRLAGSASSAQVETLIKGIIESWPMLEPLAMFMPGRCFGAGSEKYVKQLLEARPIAPNVPKLDQPSDDSD